MSSSTPAIQLDVDHPTPTIQSDVDHPTPTIQADGDHPNTQWTDGKKKGEKRQRDDSDDSDDSDGFFIAFHAGNHKTVLTVNDVTSPSKTKRRKEEINAKTTKHATLQTAMDALTTKHATLETAMDALTKQNATLQTAMDALQEFFELTSCVATNTSL
jgi:hypothetical protein